MSSPFRWIVAIATVSMVGVVGANASVYTEDFEGFASGTRLSGVPGWYYADTVSLNPGIFDGVGVAGSAGISGAKDHFNWSANTFQWSDPNITGVVIGLDFQAPAAGASYFPFRDDRVGWTIDPASNASANTFGVQLARNTASPGGFIMTGYFNNGSTRTDTIASYASPLDPNAWYRLRVAYTKLTDTSCRLDATVQAVDANGVAGAPLVTGTVLNTATWAHVPQAALFSGTMCPTFKNYDGYAYGNADNAYFEIIPEPATMSLLLAGLLFVGRRSRK